jgi:hypothetical protein
MREASARIAAGYYHSLNAPVSSAHQDILFFQSVLFLTEAVPYIRNQLTLMTDATNSSGIGATQDPTIDATLDLLDPNIRVSEVDHINEGVHRGINAMYKLMDQYTRTNGSET